MATCLHGVSLNVSTDTTSYATGSFTPVANDLLVAWVATADSTIDGTLTDSQGLGWTMIASAVRDTSTDALRLFVADTLAANTGTTVTFDCTGDDATGGQILVCRVSGMTRTGSSAVRQFKTIDNGAGGGDIDSPIFDAACLTGNPTLEAGSTADTGMLPPTNWTERADVRFTTPTLQTSYHTRNSGFTGTDINWNDGTGTTYCVIAVELDTSAAPAGGAPRLLGLLGVGT